MDEPTRRLDAPPATPEPGCVKCGGRLVQARSIEYKTGGFNHHLMLEPLSGSVLGQYMTECLAWVCISCGYTEFYAENPAVLDQ